MKIGIVTFHCAINYGAVLQAFALKEFLRSLGHEAYIVDYRPKYKRGAQRRSCVELLKHFIRECLFYPIQTTRIRRRQSFNKFCRKYQDLVPSTVLYSKNDFDVFIFGSDQIWNPEITKGFDDIFFGRFYGASGKKKIAYSVSSGTHLDFSEEEHEYLKKSLSVFYAIGVREMSLKMVLQSCSMSSVLTIDPVLLVEPSVFDKITLPIESRKPFIFLFQVGRVDGLFNRVKTLASQYDLDVVEAIADYEALRNPFAQQTLSPEEFLGYIDASAFVITTSFHGTALSLVRRKSFYTIKVNKLMDDRSSNLLESCGLKSRLVEFGGLSKLDEIEYECASGLIQELRRHSANFLKNAIMSDE